MTYHVPRISSPVEINAEWNKEPWSQIRPLTMKFHMGAEPEHKPQVHAKLAYDNDALYLIFKVDDQYVRAVAKENQKPVCWDSCVEFFFTPGKDINSGYFNVEINCGGTVVSRHQSLSRPKKRNPLSEDDIRKLEIARTMPKIVDPEITEPTTWIIEYKLPFDLLEKFCEVDRPAPGVIWKSNFYKCADKTSHPHWLTWSFIDYPKPKFHIPEHFGTLQFD